VRALLAGLALFAGAAAGEPPPAAGPAAEGTALVEALEAAPLALVGTIEGRSALDATGWRADVAVEQVLVGSAGSATVVIAWEELAPSRPPRFGRGERVLLALEPLAGGSLWRKRFPDPQQLLAAHAVAQRGTAFLRRPSLGSVSILQHYLSLPAALRGSPAGQRHLLALAADAERPLAVSAARRVSELRGDGALGAGDAGLVLRALARGASDPELASALLIWIERRQPLGLAPALDAALAAPGGAPATFVQARGLLGDGLPAERERALLASPSPEQRAAAAGVAGPAQRDRLADLVRRDPAPEVRTAALRRLARLDGPASLETVLDAFDDRETSVRNAAALQAAAFGPEVVPRLLDVAQQRPWPASQAAVRALRTANVPEARAALAQLADEHPDQRVRALASVALGRALGHKD